MISIRRTDSRTLRAIWAADAARASLAFGICILLALQVFAAASQPAPAAYPTRPIHLVVPYAPGGQGDALSRIIAQRISDILGQQVVVDHRGGAGGAIGAEYVAKSAADGYTLLFAGSSILTLAPALVPDMRYGAKDFAPIGAIARISYALAVHHSVPVTTVDGLIEYARAHPGALNYATSGSGTTSMLAFEMLKLSGDIDIVQIPYKGAAPALNDLLAGHVQILYSDLALLTQHARSGSLRIIGVAGRERAIAAPDVATLVEQGHAELSIEPWHALFVPASTPSPITDRLSAALRATLQTSEVRNRFADSGYAPLELDAAEVTRRMQNEGRTFKLLVDRMQSKSSH